MGNFKAYLQECGCMGGEATLPAIEGVSDAVDLNVQASRDPVNDILANITDGGEIIVAPEVTYERIRGILSEVGYDIPPVTEKSELFSEPEGEDVIGLIHPSLPTRVDGSGHCFLYFAFYQHEDQSYEVWAEVVTEMGLEEIFNEDIDSPGDYQE